MSVARSVDKRSTAMPLSSPVAWRRRVPQLLPSPLRALAVLHTTRRLASATTATALLLIVRADAQAVRGLGEDATIAPPGVIRIGVSNDWNRFDQTRPGGADTIYSGNALVRPTALHADLGILRRFALATTVPYVANQVVTTSSSLHPAVRNGDSVIIRGADTVVSSGHEGLGDVELQAKVVWVGDPNPRFEKQPGFHVRSAASASYWLGTGQPARSTDPFDIGTGTGQSAVEIRSQSDIRVGETFWASAIVRYTRWFADSGQVGVQPSGVPFSAVSAPVMARRELGDLWQVELTPRADLGRYFSVAVQYLYLNKAGDHYTGTKDTVINGVNAVLDAATRDSGTAFTEQHVSIGFMYSTVRPYLEGYGRFPIELSYQHSWTVSASGGRPKGQSDRIELRSYIRLWGSDFKRQQCVPGHGGCPVGMPRR